MNPWPPPREEKLPSKKNQVYLRERQINGVVTRVVEKEFTDPRRFAQEVKLVTALSPSALAVPRLLRTQPPDARGQGVLVYEYIEGRTALAYLEQNEIPQGRFLLDALTRWLAAFYALTKTQFKKQWILGDAHLRNFIYNEKSDQLYGFDFENAIPGRIEQDLARLFLFILTYEPAYAPKHQALAQSLINRANPALAMDPVILRAAIQAEAADMTARRNITLNQPLIAAIIETCR